MPISPLPPVGATPPTRPATPAAGAPAPGFADTVKQGLEGVSGLEKTADQLTQQVAAGESVPIHELMTATAKASVGVEMLTQVRNRAVEAYQEIMRLQV